MVSWAFHGFSIFSSCRCPIEIEHRLEQDLLEDVPLATWSDITAKPPKASDPLPSFRQQQPGAGHIQAM
jgi:hypothetical protein